MGHIPCKVLPVTLLVGDLFDWMVSLATTSEVTEILSWVGAILFELYFFYIRMFCFIWLILVIFMDGFSGHFLHECSINSLPSAISITSFDHVISGQICLGLHINIFWTLFFIWLFSSVGNFIYFCTPSIFYSRRTRTTARQVFWVYCVLFFRTY